MRKIIWYFEVVSHIDSGTDSQSVLDFACRMRKPLASAQFCRSALAFW